MLTFVKSWKQFSAASLWASLALLAGGTAWGQPLVINEIMYHPLQPQFGAEPVAEEFIELFNTGATNVNLAGWRFSKGGRFTFPANTVLGPGGCIVRAA